MLSYTCTDKQSTHGRCSAFVFFKGLLPSVCFCFHTNFLYNCDRAFERHRFETNCNSIFLFAIQLDSPLHRIKWLRVILDEGHTIRNPQTSLTKAMIDLVAKRRWVLTGTPIQNRLDDLWSVVKFLRLEPFDDKKWWNAALASSVRRGDEQAVK